MNVVRKLIVPILALSLFYLSGCQKEKIEVVSFNSNGVNCSSTIEESFHVSGNTDCKPNGFHSDYILDCVKNTNGVNHYHFTDESDWNGGYWKGVKDHTGISGSGFLLADGDRSDKRVWYRNVELVEGREYEFSCWLINANVNGKFRGPTSSFEFWLDGQSFYSTGDLEELDPWKEYSGTFVANKTQVVEIAIVPLGGPGMGNDFAIDDIALKEINCNDSGK